MRVRKKILLYSALVSTALMLVPAEAATGAPAARAGADTLHKYVVESVSGISLPAGSDEEGIVSCPVGTVALSGGGYIASGSVKTGLNSSFPVFNSPDPGDYEWAVSANNFGSGATTFNVYAVCAKQPKGYGWVEGPDLSNPAGDQTSTTVDCPTGKVVLGGAVGALSDSTSVGMTSSYPSPAGTQWTAAESNFSQSADEFYVIAICASSSATELSNYAIESSSASDPAGVQKGIIEHCPAPSVVLGGGNQSSNTTNLRIEMKASQPFPASGTSWKSGENNDTSAGTTLTSYAICAT